MRDYGEANIRCECFSMNPIVRLLLYGALVLVLLAPFAGFAPLLIVLLLAAAIGFGDDLVRAIARSETAQHGQDRESKTP